MFSEAEEKFILPFLKEDVSVLEYGCGESTIEIGKLVDSLISIEHTKEWHEQIKQKILANTILFLKFPDGLEKGTDGTYKQFKEYIECPEVYKPFDVIIIDGRARVGCAKFAKNLATKDTDIFIHDYNREEYKEAEKYLTLINCVENMAHFKIK